MRILSRSVAAAGLLALVALASGCGGHGYFNVLVDSEIRGPEGKLQPVAVLLVGVSDDDFAYWRDRDLNELWRNPPKEEYIKELQFGEGMDQHQVLTRKDAVWDVWERRGARWLFVIASRPTGTGGKEDPRRKWRGTARACWLSKYSFGRVNLTVNITGAGVDIPTPTRSGSPTAPPSW